ncbi:MAG: hypothetical protein PHO80_02615 [Candidatus Gracilibacteria bacterium]|nr:hypothetical protein [Candidatus Gracilibacteria bacterium]MDD4530417.1 hypothetical protein [Candidatus Gracilibacteria bacterium]
MSNPNKETNEIYNIPDASIILNDKDFNDYMKYKYPAVNLKKISEQAVKHWYTFYVGHIERVETTFDKTGERSILKITLDIDNKVTNTLIAIAGTEKKEEEAA